MQYTWPLSQAAFAPSCVQSLVNGLLTAFLQYEGRTGAEAGITFGHENMGIVMETGEGVTLLKKGDRIVLPFNVADGRCRNCEEGRTAFCTGVNPGFAGGAYGYVGKLNSSLSSRISFRSYLPHDPIHHIQTYD